MPNLAFEVHVDHTFESSVDHVTAALKAEGFGVLTRIDVRATLKEKLGVDFRRTPSSGPATRFWPTAR